MEADDRGTQCSPWIIDKITLLEDDKELNDFPYSDFDHQ